MLLVLSITFYFHYNIWGCVCSTGPLIKCDWKDISIVQVIIIIKSEVSTFFPIVFIFFSGCVPEMLLHHILYIHSGKTGNSFSLVLCSLWWVLIVGYVLACRSYSFVCTLHHLIIIIVQTLSEDIGLLKCLSDIIYRVCKIKHILSVIHYTICGAVCFQFTQFLRDDWENIHTLSYNHHQIGGRIQWSCALQRRHSALVSGQTKVSSSYQSM